jgi:hypothetical protein
VRWCDEKKCTFALSTPGLYETITYGGSKACLGFSFINGFVFFMRVSEKNQISSKGTG